MAAAGADVDVGVGAGVDVGVDAENVFVKYLPPEVTDSGLYALFAPHGDIVSCRVMRDPRTAHSLGYGFVRYSNAEQAQEAIREMSGSKCGGKTLLCKLSQASSAGNATPSDNLYVKPLLPGTREADLHALFAQHGPVKQCKVLVDPHTGRSRGIGFVRFEALDDAVKARAAMHGYRLEDDAEPLVVKFAEPSAYKAQRRAKLRANQLSAARRRAPGASGDGVNIGVGAYEAVPYEAAPYEAAPYEAAPYVPYALPYAMPYAAPYPYAPSAPSDESSVFVKHLPIELDAERLAALFASVAPVRSVLIARDARTGESRRFGFVEYFHPWHANVAVSRLHGLAVDGRPLHVALKRPSVRDRAGVGALGEALQRLSVREAGERV